MRNNSYTILQGSNSGITRLKLNDPGTYNSLSTDMLKSLISRFKELDKDQKTRVVIIEGSGKGFSAGHNLKEVKSLKGKPNYKKLFELCSKLMMVIINCDKPVIAKVHGAAFAAGCQLVATCDLALSTDNAIFSTPGVNIGLFCSTPMVALSRNVTRKKAMKMLLTGDPVSAKQAKDIGLINDHFSHDHLEEEVLKLAENISSKSRKVVKIGKKAFYKQLEMPIDKAYKYTSQVMSENMMALDAQEGISAFIEKRKPIWKDK
jgi:enoyl-CoA hydratase/carnithine racemase